MTPPPELQALVSEFSKELRADHVIAVAVVDFGAAGDQHFALSDWFTEQVANDLQRSTDGFDALVVVREHQASSTQVIGASSSDPIAPRKEVDGYVFGFLSPVPGGIRIRLVGVLVSAAHIDANHSHKVVKDIPLSEALRSWIPKDWSSLQDMNEVTFGLPPDPYMDPTVQPKCQYCPDPSYTEEARSKKISEADVETLLTIGADGRPYDIQVAGAAGYGFDQEVLKAISTWRFEPAKDKDGRPIATVVRVSNQFRLN